MSSLLLVYCFVLFAISSDALLLQKIDHDTRNVKAKSSSGGADIWALLVAGSNTWMNYRHQVSAHNYYHIKMGVQIFTVNRIATGISLPNLIVRILIILYS